MIAWSRPLGQVADAVIEAVFALVKTRNQLSSTVFMG